MAKVLIVPEKLLDSIGQDTILSRSKFELCFAKTAEEALIVTKHWQPNLVIFSNQLPKMGAQKFCQELQKTPWPIKTMMLTDQINECDLSEELDVDSHLINPVDEQLFSETIGTLLEIQTRRARRVRIYVDLIADLEDMTENSHETQTITASILSLSESGILIESPVHLAMGTVGKIHFYLPGESERFSLMCAVRLFKDELLLQYGLEFFNMQPDKQERLRIFVQKELAQNPYKGH